MPNNCARPPVECWRGASPNQAANSRPLRNVFTSPTAGRRRDGADPRNTQQPLRLFIRPGPAFNPRLQRLKSRIHPYQRLIGILYQLKFPAQPVLAILQDPRQRRPHPGAALAYIPCSANNPRT